MSYIGSPTPPVIATVSDDSITSQKIDSTSTGMTFADLTVDTDTLVVDETNNRVGIGTSSPANKLEVSGAIVAQGAVTAYTNTGLYLQNKGSSVFDVGAWRSGVSVAVLSFSTDSGSDAAPVEHMRIDGVGRVTKPDQPAFWAYCTADTNINVSSGTPVEFDAERFDVGSNFDTSTYTFTAPVTGKYFFSAGCRIDLVDTAASYYRLRVITSNQELSTIFDPNFSADLNYQTHQLASMFDMDAGDTASVNILQSGGHTSSHVNSNINYTWFTGYLLG